MRLSRKLGGLLAAAMMAVGLTAAAAPARASEPSSSPYWIIGVHPQGIDAGPFYCLQGDLGGPMGSSVTQQPCPTRGVGTPGQQWLPISLGGNKYKFENVGTGMCLEARSGAVRGMPVPLWFCDSTESNTNWAWDFPFQPPFPGTAAIESKVSGSSGFCLDIPGASTAPGTQMQLWTCNGTDAQNMYISRVPA
jgi:hypothetical protein